MKMKKCVLLLALLVSVLGMEIGGAAATAAEEVPEIQSVFSEFVTVKGNKLMEGSKELRFISYNIPELGMQEGPFWGIIDPFEQEDAIKTIVQLGGKVTRSYVFSIKVPGKDPTHIDGIGEDGSLLFNEEAFRAYDNLLALCNQYGVRLIVPFIDNWSHWGGIDDLAKLREKKPTAFWTDEQLKKDYKEIVRYVLNRTNTVTGVQYKNDPAVLAWELGNELRNAPDEWISEMAAYIKSIDNKHLVMNGRDHTYTEKMLEDPNVDILTAHYYGGDFAAKLKKDIESIQGRKPFIVGEFGLQPFAEIEGLVNTVVESDDVSGALIWSLRQHEADGGFRWHGEGDSGYSAYHWPGFEAGESYEEERVVRFLYEKSFEIDGLKAPEIPAPDAPPLLLPIDTVSDIRWRGSVGATGYDIERAEHPDGPWTVVGENISDSVIDPEYIIQRDIKDRFGKIHPNKEWRILFQDTGAVEGKSYYYRVKARNRSGETAYSNIEKVEKAVHTMGILEDPLNDFSKIAAKSGHLGFDTGNPAQFGEDASRLKRDSNTSEYIVYHTQNEMNSFQIDTFQWPYEETEDADFSFYVSGDGEQYIETKADIDQGDEDWRSVQYSADALPEGTRYLKIEFPITTENSAWNPQLSKVRIGYGKMRIASKTQDIPIIDVINTFENYNGSDEALSEDFQRNKGGDDLTVSLDPNHKCEGSYGMKFDYELSDNGYAGVMYRFDARNWSVFDCLQLWIKPDGSGRDLTIQFKTQDGSYWEMQYTCSGTETGKLNLPLSDFKRPSWQQSEEDLDLSGVTEFALYIGGDPGKGTLYFDDIRLIEGSCAVPDGK